MSDLWDTVENLSETLHAAAEMHAWTALGDEGGLDPSYLLTNRTPLELGIHAGIGAALQVLFEAGLPPFGPPPAFERTRPIHGVSTADDEEFVMGDLVEEDQT